MQKLSCRFTKPQVCSLDFGGTLLNADLDAAKTGILLPFSAGRMCSGTNCYHQTKTSFGHVRRETLDGRTKESFRYRDVTEHKTKGGPAIAEHVLFLQLCSVSFAL